MVKFEMGSNEFECLLIMCTGIDGLVDMKLIYGTIVARKKARPGREDKVTSVSFFFFFVILHTFDSS